MAHRGMEEELDAKNIQQYLKNNAIIFLEAAVNNCLDVFSTKEVMMILDDQLDMVEEAIELERQSKGGRRNRSDDIDDEGDEDESP